MAPLSFLPLALVALSGLSQAQTLFCGGQPYDPAQYVCHSGAILCPIIAGEPLSHCAGACYSTFLYTCQNNILTQLPELPAGTVYTLTAHNPTIHIHGKPVAACTQHWTIQGSTCSIPAGDVTAMRAGGQDMAVSVPGGQKFYLDQYWNVAYTRAGSGVIPGGSTTGGLRAYRGGGLMNLNEGALGWMACPPRASGPAGPAWNLVARNATNGYYVNGCTAVNLKVNERGASGVEQYT